MKKLRIHVIDDHALFRSGILGILSAWPNLESASESETVDDFLSSPQSRGVDVLMLDLSAGDHLNLDQMPQLRSRFPELHILALTMHNKPVLLKKTINAGVRGYVVKQSRPEVLFQAILRVAAGGNYLDPELSESLFQLLLDPACGEDADGAAAKGAYSSLTPREQEIFRLLAEGLRPEQIAARLFISKKTAENHRFRLMQTPGSPSQIPELANIAILVKLLRWTSLPLYLPVQVHRIPHCPAAVV
ncbi:MAG: LuxR C-terminal-related transcriptional regulator [Clostridia bacterium]|jgi:DNA-binding NarL/FixJ family response regulator